MARGSSDGLVKWTIILFVFPAALCVFSFLAHLPLAFFAQLLPLPEKPAAWTAAGVAYALGVGGAIWTCRMAWPKRRTPA